jgi:hypothetical protein
MTELKFRRMVMSVMVIVGMFLMIGLVGVTDLKIKSKSAIKEKEYTRRVVNQETPKFKKILDIELYEAEPLTTIE